MALITYSTEFKNSFSSFVHSLINQSYQNVVCIISIFVFTNCSPCVSRAQA